MASLVLGALVLNGLYSGVPPAGTSLFTCFFLEAAAPEDENSEQRSMNVSNKNNSTNYLY